MSSISNSCVALRKWLNFKRCGIRVINKCQILMSKKKKNHRKYQHRKVLKVLFLNYQTKKSKYRRSSILLQGKTLRAPHQKTRFRLCLSSLMPSTLAWCPKLCALKTICRIDLMYCDLCEIDLSFLIRYINNLSFNYINASVSLISN